MMLTTRGAYFRITPELILSLLGFPGETVLLGFGKWEPGDRYAKVYITHPDLNPMIEGADFPEISPRFRQDQETGDIELLDWGQEEIDDA